MDTQPLNPTPLASNPAPVAPPPVAPPAKPIALPFKTIGVVVIIVILILALGVWALKHAAPTALHGVSVVQGQYVNGSLLSFGWLGLSPQPLKLTQDMQLGDYAHGGTLVAVIETNPDTHAQDIYTMQKGALVQVTKDGGTKAALSVSPDGSMIAFAALTKAPTGTYFTPQMSLWTVRVLDVASGSVTDIGTGFGPEFFTHDGETKLLFTTPTGVAVADLATHTSATTYFINPGLIDYAAHISPDGSHLAMLNPLTRTYDFFTVTSIKAPLGLTPTGKSAPVLMSASFIGTTFYGVERTEQGATRLWQFMPDHPADGKVLYTFPKQTFYRVVR